MADSTSARKPDPVTGERSKSTSGSSTTAIDPSAKSHSVCGSDYDVLFHVEVYDPLKMREGLLGSQEDIANGIVDWELETEGESPLLLEARRAARDRAQGISQNPGAFTAGAVPPRSAVPADVGGRHPGLVPRTPRTDDDRVVYCDCGWFSTYRAVSGIASVRGFIRDHMFEAHFSAMADTPEMRAALQARDEAAASQGASDETVARARTEASLSSDAPPVSQKLAAEKQAANEEKARAKRDQEQRDLKRDTQKPNTQATPDKK